MASASTLVQSSPTTRSWLHSLRDHLPLLEYSEAKYYAAFKFRSSSGSPRCLVRRAPNAWPISPGWMSEGHELRRPIADYLRDGIYELRPSLAGIQHRLLYFFQGNQAAVVSHGVIKGGKVPMVEIGRAIDRMKRFQSDPSRHTFVPVKGE